MDVEAGRQGVLAAAVALEAGLLGTDTQKSSLRTERGGTEASAETLAEVLNETICRTAPRTAAPATMTSRSERPGAPGD